ncbi:MAG: dephospho-CoA kinase [Acidimicrobiia bacterium]
MDRRHLLTGGIGSGKSTAATYFEILGALVVSADRIGHEMIAPGGAAHAAVVERFPSFVVDGAVDRSRLAAHVFTERGELQALEAITHPAIRAKIHDIVDGVAGVVMVELPLIGDFLGPGWKRIVVDAPEAVRLERLLARGMGRHDAAARMAAQPTRGEWLESADLVVDNRGDLMELETECRSVWRRITNV